MALNPKASETRTIEEWVNFFKKTDIPVLKQTAKEVAHFRQHDDDISAREISASVINDPMMVFRVLSYAQNHKGRHQIQDLLQVEQAIIMMGTTNFYRCASTKLYVNELLGGNLKALTHLLKLIKRSHRAAYFATEFAVYLRDLHAEEIHVAALLHDLAEMLLWCFAPDKMNEIFQIQHTHKQYRSSAVQEAILGFKLHDLQHALVEEFCLPPLLSKLMNEDYADDKRVRSVILAVDFARHSANGWDDAALPDDYATIAAFLRIDVERTKRVLGARNIEAEAVAS